MKTISRSHGRSATAAAAYRSGTEIRCDTYGQTHDYSRKSGVIMSEVVGCDLDRQSLWNNAEQAETNKDGSLKENARVARELEVSLPCEASPGEQIDAVREMAKHIHDTYGVAVDWALHAPNPKGDERNIHAHLLFCTREIQGDGSLGKKTRTLDDKRTGSQEVEKIREKWADIVREIALDKSKWDHRSYRDRGLEREPSKHMGVTATNFERRTNQKSRRRIHQERPEPAPTKKELIIAKERRDNITSIKDDANEKIANSQKYKYTDRQKYLEIGVSKAFADWIRKELTAAKNNLYITNDKLRAKIKSMTQEPELKQNNSILPNFTSFGTPDQSNQTSQKNKEAEKEKVPYLGDLGDIGKLTPEKFISKKDRSRNKRERDPTI